MSRKDYKLRPSLSWDDMSLVIKSLDSSIRAAVAANAVSLETVKLDEIKKYLESFKPVQVSTVSSLERFMQTYGVAPVESTVVSTEPSTDSVQPNETDINSIDIVARADLSNDQKYDMLKLKKDSDYTEDEKAFMLNTGTLIMMRRAGVKPVGMGDL